jgi:hypothetical protein
MKPGQTKPCGNGHERQRQKGGNAVIHANHENSGKDSHFKNQSPRQPVV